MALWLFKQEPSCYSFADLERDGETLWDGVSNALARKHLRETKVGDRVLFYHTGKERAVVGEMVVSAGPQADPKSDDAKAVVVKVKMVQKFATPVTLEQIKADPFLAKWDLVRLPRLSVVPVTEAEWAKVLKFAGESGV